MHRLPNKLTLQCTISANIDGGRYICSTPFVGILVVRVIGGISVDERALSEERNEKKSDDFVEYHYY